MNSKTFDHGIGDCRLRRSDPGIARFSRWLPLLILGVMGLVHSPARCQELKQTNSPSAAKIPLEIEDAQPPLDDSGDALGLNPDFIAAYRSLDESLKYEPEKAQQIRNRIVATGVVGGALLGILVVAFGYLKLNLLTRGFYSGRLQTMAIASAILILGLCYFLWTQVLFQ